jgi:hypothetical protein
VPMIQVELYILQQQELAMTIRSMSSQMIIQIKQKQDDKSFKLYQNPVFIRNTVLSATNMDQSIVDVGIGHFFHHIDLTHLNLETLNFVVYFVLVVIVLVIIFTNQNAANQELLISLKKNQNLN